jgi:sporulation protein YlmC with PRC-barrel domain
MSQQVVQLEKLGDSSLTIEPEAADIRGRTVKERDGEEIGEVDDLFVDVQERRVRMMQVASGGFLGLGESKSIIPIDAITKITED